MSIRFPIFNNQIFERKLDKWFISTPKQDRPTYYHVSSLPVYSLGGFLRKKIEVPENLMMAVLNDQGSRLFTGCRKAEDSERLWICQDQDDIPISISQCVISTFNEDTTNCDGNLNFGYLSIWVK